MKSDYSFYGSINFRVQEYRKQFLKRKNINGYKKNNKGTPIVIDKLINAFERKIKGKKIFTDAVKKEYFKGLKIVFAKYYDETFQPKISRKDSYINYLAEQYIIYGKKTYKHKSISFKEFISSGMSKHYR